MNFKDIIFKEIANEDFERCPPELSRQKAFSNIIGYEFNYPDNMNYFNYEIDIDETIYKFIPPNNISHNIMHRRSNSETKPHVKLLDLKRINTF